MQFTVPRTTFSEDGICGFLGGAMAGFNGGLLLLPHTGILTPLETLALCALSGMLLSWLMLSARGNS